MLEAHLYPYSWLEPWDARKLTVADRTQLAAALLLFDGLTLSGWRYPATFVELKRELDEVNSEIDRIRSRLGSDRVDGFIERQETDGVTFGDAACIYYAMYIHGVATFFQSYHPLLNEGILNFTALSDFVFDSDDSQYVGLDRLHAFMRPRGELFKTWQADRKNLETVLRLCHDWTNGMWSIAYPIAKSWRGTEHEWMWNVPVDASGNLYVNFCLGALVAHSLCGANIGTPRIYLGSDAVDVGQAFYSIVGTAKEAADAAKVAHLLFSRIIMALPAILPRSPEAILELRFRLGDELGELRQTIYSVALDIAHQKSTSDRVDAALVQRFLHPLETLKRRLQHPARDLARNIVTGAPLAAAVTLAVAPLIGLPLSIGSLVGLALDTLTAAAKTAVERNRRVEESPVAFLFRAHDQ